MQQLDFVASNVEQVSAVEQERYEVQRVQVAGLVRAQGFDAAREAHILEALDLS